MRSIAICILLASASVACAENVTHFYPIGTKVRFTVDSSAFTGTPKWQPGEGRLPLSSNDAIAVAMRYHNSLSFSRSPAEFHRWRLAKAILISHDDEHWYWVVTYKGVFDEKLIGKGIPNYGGHSVPGGPKEIYTHYPVLFSGEMPKPFRRQRDDPHRPAETVDDLIEMLESDGAIFTPVLNSNEWPPLNNGTPPGATDNRIHRSGGGDSTYTGNRTPAAR